MVVKETLKTIPFLDNFLRKIKQFILPPKAAGEIKGNNNRVINEGSFNNVVLDICGNNNEIRIGKN